MQGPRWNLREIDTYSTDRNLVILLDLSESMNATDVKPTRLIRAKQKIEDFINLSKGVKMGLVAFAADPHMMAPITEDKETIRHLLPSLETSLVYLQGSRLSSAVEMASKMLEVEPGNNKAVLIITDGGFEDTAAFTAVKNLATKGVVIHLMGIGTVEGAPLKDPEGNLMKKNGIPLLSKLEKEKLLEISKIGRGHYMESLYSDRDEKLILKELEMGDQVQMDKGKKIQLWEEHFYLFIIPVLPFILWWFKRGYVFPLVLMLAIPAFQLEGVEIGDYFLNSEQRGKQAYEKGDYQQAQEIFQDPYRKGVSLYRVGEFAEAEKMFRQSHRDEVALDATYNLGNALAQQEKFKDAIDAYETVLEKQPNHIRAKENLELVKQMLEEQKQESSNSKEKPNPDQSEEDTETSESEDVENSPGNEKPEESSSPQNDDQEINNTQDQNKNSPEEHETQESNDQEEIEQPQVEPQDNGEGKKEKSQEDQDADLWLNRLSNDPSTFLKNKFYIESKKNGAKEGIDPW